MLKHMTVKRRQAECPKDKSVVDDCPDCEHCLPVLTGSGTIRECLSDDPPDEQYLLYFLCDLLPGGGYGGLAGVQEGTPVYPPIEYNTRIFIDGNQWCCIRGLNLQEGVAGFGDTPEEAVDEFEQAWAESDRKR